MCEANAYLNNGKTEQLLMEAVDIIEAEQDGRYRLVSIFGDQKIVKGRITRMSLVDHRVIFEV